MLYHMGLYQIHPFGTTFNTIFNDPFLSRFIDKFAFDNNKYISSKKEQNLHIMIKFHRSFSNIKNINQLLKTRTILYRIVTQVRKTESFSKVSDPRKGSNQENLLISHRSK